MRNLGLEYPAADTDPPILPEECEEGNVAICRYHGGKVRDGLASGDYFGRVYLCPIGGMYWRLTKPKLGMNTPLRWPKGM